MLYVEPAGGSPEMFSRGFEYLFFAQQATADKQGKLFGEYIAGLPEGERPETAAYPTIDDPFAAPNVAGVQAILEAAGIETVYEETYAIDTKNFDTIVNAMKAKNPDVVVHGAVFEDGVGLVRSMLKADFTPTWLYQTTAPVARRPVRRGRRCRRTPRASCSPSATRPRPTPPATPSSSPSTKRCSAPPRSPEDAADAFAAGQVLQAAVEAVGSIDDQEAMADWLRDNAVDTILGDLEWNEDGSPNGEFLIGQWQGDGVEFVLPEEFATSDELVQGWMPGGAG